MSCPRALRVEPQIDALRTVLCAGTLLADVELGRVRDNPAVVEALLNFTRYNTRMVRSVPRPNPKQPVCLHATACPACRQFLEDAARAHDFLAKARAAEQPIWSKLDSPSVVKLLGKALAQLTEVYSFVLLSDPPLSLDYATVGETLAFDPSRHEAFDARIQARQTCVVVFPALLGGAGDLKVKAQALELGVCRGAKK